MKKIIEIILLLVISVNVSYSQGEVEYDIYLIFNSENNEVYIKEFNFEDKIYKFFNFSKGVKKCTSSYSLDVNHKGKLIKNLKGKSSFPIFSTTLTYDPTLNKSKKVLKTEPVNKISYKDFMDVSFENFSNILKNAQKVYVIDSGSKENEDIYYIAYEVDFK